MRVLENTGDYVLNALQGVGEAALLLLRGLSWSYQALKYRALVSEQMLFSGVESLPVVMVVAFFVGMVVSLQTGQEMARFQLQDNIGGIVAASMFREMGPVFSALIVAGRVGSSMAAQLGTMKVSEEIDALEAMSINPVRYLVMPRVLALLVMMPVLTLFANGVGLIGGALVGRYQIGVSYYTFFDTVVRNIQIRDITSGLIKAATFGLIIGSVSCHQGLKAAEGARGVGRATTRSLVYSFLFILMFDYFITAFIY